MDDTKLRAFLAAVKCGSFSKAAEHLDYSQSGLTHMMDKLEEELGCVLLNRDYRGVCLTEQGKMLLPEIENVIDANNALYTAATHLKKAVPQQIHLGIYPSISRTFLPAILQKFQETYPDINVDVTVAGKELSSKLFSGELQLAFMEKRYAQGFDWIPLMSKPLVAVLPPDDPRDTSAPLALSELLSEHFFTSPEYIELILQDRPSNSCTVIDSDDDGTIISMVASGLGVSVLTEPSLKGFEKTVKIVPLKEQIEFEIGAGLKSLKHASPAVKTFVSFLKKANFFMT